MSIASSPKRRPLKRGVKAALLVGWILSLALLTEAGARVLFWSQGRSASEFVLTRNDPHMKLEGRYVSAPFLPFDLRPSSQHEIIWTPPDWPELAANGQEAHVWKIAHNSWGFRGPEVSLEKPAGTLRVLCLGGSTTYDTATDGETWPEKLQQRLAEAYPGRRIEVLNFGMNGSSLPFQISKFALTGVHFQPDLVMIYPGHNDLWAGLGLQGFRPDYSHQLGHWDDSRRTLQRWVPTWAMRSVAITGLVVAIDRLRGIQYDLIMQIWQGAPPAEDDLEGVWAFQAGLETLQGIAAAHDAEFMVITPFWAFRKEARQERLVERMKATAVEADIPIFDAANLVPSGDASLVVDDVHFSEKGGSLFARMVADFIEARKLLE